MEGRAQERDALCAWLSQIHAKCTSVSALDDVGCLSRVLEAVGVPGVNSRRWHGTAAGRIGDSPSSIKRLLDLLSAHLSELRVTRAATKQGSQAESRSGDPKEQRLMSLARSVLLAAVNGPDNIGQIKRIGDLSLDHQRQLMHIIETAEGDRSRTIPSAATRGVAVVSRVENDSMTPTRKPSAQAMATENRQLKRELSSLQADLDALRTGSETSPSPTPSGSLSRPAFSPDGEVGATSIRQASAQLVTPKEIYLGRQVTELQDALGQIEASLEKKEQECLAKDRELARLAEESRNDIQDVCKTSPYRELQADHEDLLERARKLETVNKKYARKLEELSQIQVSMSQEDQVRAALERRVEELTRQTSMLETYRRKLQTTSAENASMTRLIVELQKQPAPSSTEGLRQRRIDDNAEGTVTAPVESGGGDSQDVVIDPAASPAAGTREAALRAQLAASVKKQLQLEQIVSNQRLALMQFEGARGGDDPTGKGHVADRDGKVAESLSAEESERSSGSGVQYQSEIMRSPRKRMLPRQGESQQQSASVTSQMRRLLKRQEEVIGSYRTKLETARSSNGVEHLRTELQQQAQKHEHYRRLAEQRETRLRHENACLAQGFHDLAYRLQQGNLDLQRAMATPRGSLAAARSAADLLHSYR